MTMSAADNGVIHVIDTVIMPTAAKPAKMSKGGKMSKTSMNNAGGNSSAGMMKPMDNGSVKL